MTRKCCIPYCTKSEENSSVILHDFPSNPDIAAKWIRNINLFLKCGGTWFPQADSVLCSAHFLPNDFIPTNKKKVLKRKSAPSLFEWHDFKSTRPTQQPRKPEKSPIIEVLKPKTVGNTTYSFSSPIVSNDKTKSIQVSKVMSLSGANSSPFITLPSKSPNLTPQNPKSTPALFNGQQLILLPQIPSSPHGGNTGFIIIPEGRPLPNLGKDLVLLPGGAGSPLPSTGNVLVLQQQPNLPIANNSSINNNKDSLIKPKNYCNDKSILRAIPKSNSNFPEIIEDEIDAYTLEHGNKDGTSANTSAETPLVSIIDNKIKTSLSKISSQKRPLSEIDKSQDAFVKRQRTSTFSSKKQSSDLIEIAPSTFMKINPDIIKVAKKETPNGNTVLQFIMNPNLVALNNNQPFFSFSKPTSLNDSSAQGNDADQTKIDEAVNLDDPNDMNNHIPDSTSQNEELQSGINESASGPVLAFTHLSGNHTFQAARMKYAKSLKMKSVQVHRLTAKVKDLQQKLEELENKCIVQERQLNFASLKKLKQIKKNADQGDSHASFILEQIRGYANKNRVVWSDTTLIQCSIWCRKAPYAYEYFKKADLFRLPALTTIKRFMTRNPEIKLQIKNKAFKKPSCDDSSSSSDFDSEFDFDETDNENIHEHLNEISVACENISCELVEDSQSSLPMNLEPVIELNVGPQSALNDSPQSTIESHPLIIPASISDKVKSVDQRQPLTNIFGKILCRAPKLTNSTPTETGNEMIDQKSETSNDAENQDVTVANNQEVIMSDNDRQFINNNNEDSISQELIINKDESIQLINDIDSNNQELIVHQEVLSVQEPDVVDDDSNSYYLQTSEEDGVTTINLNGQEIVIPPGTILKLNSDLIGSDELGNHFLIIPSADEGVTLDDQQCVITDDQQCVITDDQQCVITDEQNNIESAALEQSADVNILPNTEEIVQNDVTTTTTTTSDIISE